MKLPTAQVGQQFQCGSSANEKGEYVGLVGFGRGNKLIRGSAYIAGPLMIGNPSSWIARENFNEANVMIARCGNTEADPESIPAIFKITNKDSGIETRVNDIELGDTGGGEVGIQIYSSSFNQVNLETYKITTPNLELIGDFTQTGDMDVTGDYTSSGKITISGKVTCGSLASGSPKSFDIPHPNIEGYRLQHACPEGPEAAIYVRGKVSIDGIIELPDYWQNFVDKETISVQLTPIGAYQKLFVDRIEDGRVYIKNQEGGEIDAYYQVWVNRGDVSLEVEYPDTE